MKLTRSTRLVAIVSASALALTLAACGNSDQSANPGGSTKPTSGSVSGTIAGAGASSQSKAVDAWIAGTTAESPDLAITYDPSGSGAGIEQFSSGGVNFAGSDAYLTEEQVAAAKKTHGGDVVELPLYISPIAVVYNVPDLSAEHVQLSAETLAKIFDGKIKNWNDAAIAAENTGVTLPDLAIIPVNRSDKSGTTQNFVDYLAKAGNGAWTHEVSSEWPVSGTQSGEGTQGLIDIVAGAKGAIGYADASRAGDLGTVAIKVGDSFNAPSAAGASKVFDISKAASTASATQIVVDLDRTTTDADAYPLVLVSYTIASSKYADANVAAGVKAYLTYAASAAGQTVAADAKVAGSAPISDDLRAKVDAAIATITAG